MFADFVKSISDLLRDNALTRQEADKLALRFGIDDKTVKKELIELSIVIVAREIAQQNLPIEIRFKQIVELYKNQVNLSHRTSQSIIFQQYSTPAPIAFLAGEYVKHGQKQNYQIFEPSAGNGLLTICFPERNCLVNEIDNLRNDNLNTQDFIQVLKVDATSELAKDLRFEKKFDGIITNPPFGTYDKTISFSGFPIKHLDHIMAIRALDCMKDEGRAAIIIGSHTKYDEAGRIQAGKNRIFLSYLYKHYDVDDIINIDGSLYSKQGTSFDVRLILICGRKLKPEGFPPLKSDNANPVTDFENLYERVIRHFGNKGNRLKVAMAKAKSIMLLQLQGT